MHEPVPTPPLDHLASYNARLMIGDGAHMVGRQCRAQSRGSIGPALDPTMTDIVLSPCLPYRFMRRL